jgi:hypothetical protein
MICSTIAELRETDITLGKPRRVARGTYACAIQGNSDELMSQTAVCRMAGGVRGLEAPSVTSASLLFHDDDGANYVDFVDTLATTVAESLPSTLTDLLYGKEELSSEDLETLLRLPTERTPGGGGAGGEGSEHRAMAVSIRRAEAEGGAAGVPRVTLYDPDSRVISLDGLAKNQSEGDIMCILHAREAVCTEDDIRVVFDVHQLMCLEEPQPDEPRNLFRPPPRAEPAEVARADDADSMLTDVAEESSPDRKRNCSEKEDQVSEDRSEAAGEDRRENTIKISIEPEADGSGGEPGLEPVDIDYGALDGEVELKDKKKVYRELYHSALKEAKIHQQNAIKAYLQAKQIKHEYFEDDSDIESLMSFDDDVAAGAEELEAGGRARVGTAGDGGEDADDRSVATDEIGSEYGSDSDSDSDDYSDLDA